MLQNDDDKYLSILFLYWIRLRTLVRGLYVYEVIKHEYQHDGCVSVCVCVCVRVCVRVCVCERERERALNKLLCLNRTISSKFRHTFDYQCAMVFVCYMWHVQHKWACADN